MSHLELARLLAGTAASREAHAPRIRELAASCDLALLARDLESARVLPLLGGRLAGMADVPAGFTQQVAAAHARDRAAGLALQAATERVTGALAADGIRAIALKGPGLAERAHGDIGLRDAGDIDLLLAREDLDGAAAVVRGLGYAEADRLEELHLTFAHPDGLPDVELHWRVHWLEEAFSRQMLDDPDPADEAAALLLIHARDGLLGLRMPADLAAWWDRHGEPGMLDGHAARHPRLVPVWQAAALSLARTAGIPPEVWATLPAPRRRVRLAVRLGSWSGRGERDQLVANTALIDGLLTPPRALPAFLRRQRAGAPGSRAVHLAKVAGRWATALWRVRRGPWDPL